MCWGTTKSSAVFHVNRVSRILQLGTLIPWKPLSHDQQNIPYSLSFLKRTILCSTRHFDHFSKSKIYERYTRNKFLMYTSRYEISTKYPLNEPNSFSKTCGDWVTSKSNLPNYNNDSFWGTFTGFLKLLLIILSCKLSLTIPLNPPPSFVHRTVNAHLHTQQSTRFLRTRSCWYWSLCS